MSGPPPGPATTRPRVSSSTITPKAAMRSYASMTSTSLRPTKPSVVAARSMGALAPSSRIPSRRNSSTQ